MKISKRQARLEDKRQDSVTDTIKMDGSKYICIFDVKAKWLNTYTYCNEDWEQISKDPYWTAPTHTLFLSRFVAEHFDDYSASNFYAVGLVVRHLKEIDAKLLELIDVEKHNTFFIVIDVDGYENGKVIQPSFLFSSTSSETLDYTKEWGNATANMYLQTPFENVPDALLGKMDTKFNLTNATALYTQPH